MDDKPIEDKKKLLEDLEDKSLLYKLKRWEKKILNYLRSLFYKNEKMKEHLKKMEEQKRDFDEKVKNENDNFERISKEIENKKKRELNLIEENKNQKIENNTQKYNNIISYLEIIKNDRKKLIEFFNNYNNLF